MILEIAVLSCIEATAIADRIRYRDNLPHEIKKELIREVYQRSDCKNGHV